MRWKDKLNKAELKHVREFGGRTLAGFKNTRAFHLEFIKKDKKAGRAGFEPCWYCHLIARKLGLEGGTKDA